MTNNGFLTINPAILMEHGLHYYKDKQIFFGQKRNLVIGPNGGGKTRLLKAVQKSYEEQGYKVIFVDFPAVFGGAFADINKEDVEESIYNIMVNKSESFNFPDIMKLIESDALTFIEKLRGKYDDAYKAEKKRVMSVADTFNRMLEKFINAGLFTFLAKDLNDNVQIYDEQQFADKFKEMSPGERNLLYISIFLTQFSIHHNHRKLAILIDEPELHLHYKLIRLFVKTVEEVFSEAPIWVASHSIHLLTRYSFSEIVYASNNEIKKETGGLRSEITKALLDVDGDDSEVDGLYELLLDVESEEYLGFVRECFDPAGVVGAPMEGKVDPQFKVFLTDIHKKLAEGKPVHILDYGAGYGRFGVMLKNEIGNYKDMLVYDTFYLEEKYKDLREGSFPPGNDYGTYEGVIPKAKYDIILLVNTLHEIPVSCWKTVFDTIYWALAPEGYLFFCEAQVLSVGEKPDKNVEHGYLVLGKEEIEMLLPDNNAKISEDEKIVYSQIPAANFKEVSCDRIHSTLRSLSENARKKAMELTKSKKTARKRAFYSLQHINADLASEVISAKVEKDKKAQTSIELLSQTLQKEDFSLRQLIRYSWRSAVRALPFLFYRGNLDFWGLKHQQDYLYMIFYTLDSCLAEYIKTEKEKYSENSEELIIINDLITDAVDSIDNVNDVVVRSVVFSVVNAVIVANKRLLNKVNSPKVSYPLEKKIRDRAVAAVQATINAANGVDVTANIDLLSFCEILFSDVIFIEQDARIEDKTDIYGDIWEKFRKQLEDCGCSYWFKYYEKLFSEGFTIDIEELQRRLNVPLEIKKQGAQMVGKYMENQTTPAT